MCSVTIPVELLLDVVSGISRKVIFKHMYTPLSILKLGKGFCLSMLHLSSLLRSIPIFSNSVYFVHSVFSAPATSWRMKLLLNMFMSLLMEQGYNV
ncbi:hypothetical protein ACE6H2_007345 [Prunus campanulata]